MPGPRVRARGATPPAPGLGLLVPSRERSFWFAATATIMKVAAASRPTVRRLRVQLSEAERQASRGRETGLDDGGLPSRCNWAQTIASDPMGAAAPGPKERMGGGRGRT